MEQNTDNGYNYNYIEFIQQNQEFEINVDNVEASIPKKRITVELPNEYAGIKLTDEIKDHLLKGEYTDLLEGLYDGERVRNAKLKLIKNEEGDFSIAEFEAYESLNIPDKIGDHKLTEEDKTNLIEKGQLIGPYKIHKRKPEQFLAIDQELNRIVVKTKNEVGIPTEFSGYKFTKDEQNKLANGQKLDPIVFKGKSGHYFTAEISVHLDKDSITYKFDNPVALTKEKAKEIMEQQKINKKDNPSLIENITNQVQETHDNEKNKTHHQISEEHIEKIQNQDDKLILEAIQDKNLNKLIDLTSNGVKPSESLKTTIYKDQSIPEVQKSVIMTKLGIDINKEKKKIQDSNKEKKQKELEENHTKNRTVQKTANAITKASHLLRD